MTAGRTVLFSGFTVAAAMVALVFLPQRFLYSLGAAGAAVGILSGLIAVFVVPALLALLGTRIDALSIRRGPAVTDESGGWYRLARAVMRRPLTVALASSALLLAASAPLLWTVLTGPSAEAVPPGQPSYEAATYVERHYPRDVIEAVTVTVRGDATPGQLAQLRRRIDAIDGIERGAPFARASENVAYANFAATGPALDGGTQEAVEAIRSLGPPGAGEIMVSGNTARFVDQKESLVEHIPLVVTSSQRPRWCCCSCSPARCCCRSRRC